MPVNTYSDRIDANYMINKSMRDPDFLNAIIENVGALVVVLNHEGRVHRFNSTCEKLSGFTFNEVVGKFLWDVVLLAEDAQTIRQKAFISVSQNPQIAVSHYTNHWRTKSGALRLIEWTNTLLRDGEGHTEYMISIGMDITERKQMEENLRKSEERLHMAVNAVNDGIWDWNPMNHECYLSPRWKEILGYTDEELPNIDSSFFSLLHPDDRAAFDQAVTNHLVHHQPYHVETRLRHKDGGYRWILSRGQVVRNEDGQPVRMLGSITDISDRKQAEENLRTLTEGLEARVRHRTAELTEARDLAERANRAKSEFLSRMSHELRTPMNAILGFSHLLEFQDLPAKQLSYVQEIHRAGDYLLDLINELLDLARIEAGKMSILLQAVEVNYAVSAAIEIVRPLCGKKQIRLVNRCDEPGSVLADPTRLRQILVNLLSNAIKYNRQEGSIEVTCRQMEKNLLQVSVTDTGRGIPIDKQGDLFKPFERLGAEFTEVEGTGIGLAISKQVAELMGAKLGFISEPEKGSTFWIEISLAPQKSQSDVLPLKRKKAQIDHQNHLVLYIEDNAANLRVVEAMFQHMPHLKLISAPRGEFGLELARRYKPDIILLDIHLPGMDGYAVLEALKADPITCDIPVFALSADAMTVDIERGLRAGFIKYLTKPVKMNVLQDAIGSYLNGTEDLNA